MKNKGQQMKHHELESAEDKKKESCLKCNAIKSSLTCLEWKKYEIIRTDALHIFKKLLFHQYFWCKLNSQDDLTNDFR